MPGIELGERDMKGDILGYSDVDGGAITGEDGARYRFGKSDWRGADLPVAGGRVDFDVADGRAIDIYPLAGTGQLAASPVTAPMPAPAAPAVAASGSAIPLWRTPLFGLGVTAVILIYVFLIPPSLFHPMAGNLKPLLLIGLSIAAIVWRNKRSFDRTNQYGVESFRGFGHVVGSGAIDLVAGLGAIVGLIVGGFALIL